MPEIYIIPNGDGAWPEIVGRERYHLGEGAPAIQIALLKAGMGSGKSSVTIRIDLPDGKRSSSQKRRSRSLSLRPKP